MSARSSSRPPPHSPPPTQPSPPSPPLPLPPASVTSLAAERYSRLKHWLHDPTPSSSPVTSADLPSLPPPSPPAPPKRPRPPPRPPAYAPPRASSRRRPPAPPYRRDATLPPVASDLGSGFERVISEHLPATPSAKALGRTDSGISAVASGNPVAALRLTFMSMKSYGNTEMSSGSLADDPAANAFVGGLYRSHWSSSDWGAAKWRDSRVEDAAGDLYVSESIDKCWTIREKLGEGAFSEVRLAEGKNGQGLVAVKIVSKGAPDLFADGLCREVVSGKLAGEHPNVVRYQKVYEDDRFIYLVMELLTGGQMLPRVADSHYYPRYCENDVVTLVRGLTRALAHLHRRGIAHRDVKPENILFASDTLDPTVKLTDLGIAFTECGKRNATDMIGTPLYVAPEVLLRQPYGCAADMWSLGVIVHILLTGYPPFDDNDLVQLINNVKHKPMALLGEEWIVISEDAKDFVQRLLTRDVEKRLTAEQALAHAWLTTPRPPPFPAPPMPSRAVNAPQRVKIPPTKQSRNDGTIPLMVAQVNLQSFVVRKEWKRMVESEQSERNMKLAMLVSLSEKNLAEKDTKENKCERKCRTQTTVCETRRERCSDARYVCRPKGGEEGCATKTSACVKREKVCVKRKSGDLEHQQEQERLRQQRLQLQAELSKKKKLAAKQKAEESTERITTVSTESLSSRSSCSKEPGGETDESLVLSEAFQMRREADAETDAGKIQQQRGVIIGRRGRQSSGSNSARVSGKSERRKGKGKRESREKTNRGRSKDRKNRGTASGGVC